MDVQVKVTAACINISVLDIVFIATYFLCNFLSHCCQRYILVCSGSDQWRLLLYSHGHWFRGTLSVDPDQPRITGLHFLRILYHTNMSWWYMVLKLKVYIFILRLWKVHPWMVKLMLLKAFSSFCCHILLQLP
jgi:hypothetical protein